MNSKKSTSATSSPARDTVKKIRAKRLTGMQADIRAYEPNFNFKKLEEAIAWAEKRFKSSKIPTVNDLFADPLLIAERLAKYKADGAEILAAVLYPAVRPLEGRGIDNFGLREIKDQFGDRVLGLVTHTLGLWAHDVLPLDPRAEQTPEEQLSGIRLMALRAAQEPGPVRIRATQSLLNMEAFRETGSSLTRRDEAQLTWEAETILGPIAYVAGFSKLSYDLHNAVYFLKNPAEFANTRMAIDKVDGTKVTDQDLQDVKAQIVQVIESKCGIGKDFFDVEIRRKSAWSARRKAAHKKMNVEELSDRYGFRVILKANQEGRRDFNVNALDESEREMLLGTLGDLCHDVYSNLSRHFGSGRNSVLKAKLMAEFDDYINRPRESGYSAIQGLFPIRVGKKLIMMEGQVVDEIRHEVNTYGPRSGHVYYKTGLGKHGDLILDWYKNAALTIHGEEAASQPVSVYDNKNQVIHGGPGFSVLDFARSVDPNNANDVIGAQISNPDPFANRDFETSYGPFSKLRNGDRIIGLQYRNYDI